MSATVPDENPFGLEALQVKSSVPPCEMVRLMSVTVSRGLTPVQFGFGHPSAAPDTVDGADNVAGFVTNARFPFFTSLPGMCVGAVAGPQAVARAARDPLIGSSP